MRAELNKGWFAIPGVQRGDRTLEEQLRGLDPMLAACAGKTVWDVGCAEGLIAFRCARAGAEAVLGSECNLRLVEVAHAQIAALPRDVRARVKVEHEDVGEVVRAGAPRPHDIVLALAVLHKLPDPTGSLVYLASCARELLVLRLPGGSDGRVFVTKNRLERCDVRHTMQVIGWRMVRAVAGPRGELVQYWAR